ncbi:glucose-6-phosphate isomerase family protein [Candidatus Omnitrophota bacterium]
MIIDLKEKSGLNLKLDLDKPELVFGNGLQSAPPGIRTIGEMKEVLLDKDIQEPQELYYMYRDVHQQTDQVVLEQHNLRYDVTMIKPFCLGGEFMKTAGHYHPDNFGELYEVLSGRCFCMLQRPSKEDYRVVEEVIVVEASAGEKIVIPPGFGHILINPGKDYLVTANWVSSRFASSYELYKKAEGAAYFITNSQEELISPNFKIKLGIIANPHYKTVADIAFVQPSKQIKRFGLMENSPMYNLINEEASKLDFLNQPLDYQYSDVFVYSDKQEK